MSLEIRDSALLFCAATIIGLVSTGLARWISHRTGILDYPGERKVHRGPVAYLGGLGFAMAVMLGTAGYAILRPIDALVGETAIYSFVGGLLAVFLIGLWDDVKGMRPIVKLGSQMAVGLAMWLAGVRIERVTISFGKPLELVGSLSEQMAQGWGDLGMILVACLPSILLTVGWYVALMNAVNLIDGLDGLAGGVTFIGALSLGVVGLLVPHMAFTIGLAIPFIVAGACLGFLFHNWHPARIFLGDSGSLSIGYVLATASLLSSTKAPALLTLLIPMVALGLPLFESAFSFTRRLIKGQHPFKADRRHLHHRLLDLGLSQRRVVLVFWYATLYLGVNSVLLARSKSMLLLINVGLLGLGLVMLIEYLRFLEKRRETSTEVPVAPVVNHQTN